MSMVESHSKVEIKVIESKWKRENWMEEGISKGKGELSKTSKTTKEPISKQIHKGLYYKLSNKDSHRSTSHLVQTKGLSQRVLGIYCSYSKIGEFPDKSAT